MYSVDGCWPGENKKNLVLWTGKFTNVLITLQKFQITADKTETTEHRNLEFKFFAPLFLGGLETQGGVT